uniref:Putative secreted protein n=1 Tax=Anopheles triannulatus TaxID=58253 RepID=A0A2M4B6T4_9DIPT
MACVAPRILSSLIWSRNCLSIPFSATLFSWSSRSSVVPRNGTCEGVPQYCSICFQEIWMQRPGTVDRIWVV